MARGTKASKEARRQVVVAGKIAGKAKALIARDAGCSVRHVDRLATESETQLNIRELLQKRAAQIDRSVGYVMDKIEALLDPNDATLRADEAMRAADQLRKWVELLRDSQSLAEPRMRLPTYEEFELILRARRMNGTSEDKTVECKRLPSAD